MEYQTNLRTERKKRKWTLEFVGKETGVTKHTVYCWEKGIRKPSYEVLCALEDLFQLPHRYLLAQAGEEVPALSCYCKNLDSSIVAGEKGNKQ